MSLEQFTPEPWIPGNTADSIVSPMKVGDYQMDEDDLKHYGGYLIAECIDPCNRPLIAQAPAMYYMLRRIKSFAPKAIQNEINSLLKAANPILVTEKVTKANPDPRIHEVQFYFYTKYKEAFGKDYVASFGKDGAIFRDLIKVPISVNEIKWLIDQFFASEDAFIAKSDRGVGVFKSQVNRLRSPISEKNEILKSLGLK